jgi:hypothetical protein
MRIALLAGIFACCSFAQPPDLIRVVRPGLVPLNSYISFDAYDKAAVDVVGMSTLAGPAETWLIELHGSFTSIENMDKVRSSGIPTNGPVLGDEVLPSTRAWIARHRPESSYRPELAIQNLVKARYLDVVIYRIPPGAEADFIKAQKATQASLDSVNSDRPNISYEVISGAPSGTYISLTPLSSLRPLDDGRPAAPVYAEAAAANAKQLAGSLAIQRERLLFRLEPRQSFVSDRFASADPSFWHP